jgi:glycosyltransferase involved in cell wall biosynthesis
MMDVSPLISIIMPVKNGARFLSQALADIEAQTYRHLEVIVVDGRSNDGSADIAAGWGARVIEQPGDGFADAWNLGIVAARGSLLAFLDSDDRWDPDKLSAQVEILRRRPEVDYVLTRVQMFVEPGFPHPPGFQARVLEGDHDAYMPSALLIRRSALDRVGPFRTDLVIASDIDWFARSKDAGLELAIVPRVMVRKRAHDANVMYFRGQKFNRELLGLLRESIGRQRRTVP